MISGLLLVVVLSARSEELTNRQFLNMTAVLAAAKASDWRPLDPENTIYVEFASGRVVIELAPAFAPCHVANVKALAREGYYDGLAIVRVQDNYVVQWADPNAEKQDLARKIQHAQKTLPAEFERTIDRKLPFLRLPDGDVYAREVGFYEKPEQRMPIKNIRVAADVAVHERSPLEVMRTDTAAYQALIKSRRNRRDQWFQVPAGRVELGNVPIPVRLTGGDGH